jgi:hypothetical protein
VNTPSRHDGSVGFESPALYRTDRSIWINARRLGSLGRFNPYGEYNLQVRTLVRSSARVTELAYVAALEAVFWWFKSTRGYYGKSSTVSRCAVAQEGLLVL